MELQLPHSDFENQFSDTASIDGHFQRIKEAISDEDKKILLVDIFSSGVDFHADPHTVVKNQVTGNRYLYMFDKYFQNKYSIHSGLFDDDLFKKFEEAVKNLHATKYNANEHTNKYLKS